MAHVKKIEYMHQESYKFNQNQGQNKSTTLSFILESE